jgi:hypothetical protein
MYSEKRENALGYGASERDLIICKGNTAAHETRGTRRGIRIEDLAFQNGCIVARICSAGRPA